MRRKLVSFPGRLPPVHFCSLQVFTYWKQSKTGRWEGLSDLENDATPNQAYSNLVPPLTTEQYHRFTASNRYTAIVQTRSSPYTSRARLNRFEAGVVVQVVPPSKCPPGQSALVQDVPPDSLP